MLQREPLRQGSRGDDVLAWQYFLAGRGYADVVGTGEFDAVTLGATIAYQRDSGLAADGIAGNRTLGLAMMQGLPMVGAHDPYPPRPLDLSPLFGVADRTDALGDLQWRSHPTPADPDAVEVTNDWSARYLVTVRVPQLAARGFEHVRFHKYGVDALLGLWADWEKQGLLPIVRSFDGALSQRVSRGTTHLSMHAYGAAFDINARWNPLGNVPAFAGEEGSTRALVRSANARGFFWGGHFSTRLDGMHFELTKKALQVPDVA